MQKSATPFIRPEAPAARRETDPRVVAVCAVVLLTALRVLALAYSDADLFVDEAQYWLWGQELDWGYYSKPPLIAWVIRAVTDLAGSDAAFWVRLPGPIFHGLTAVLLMAAAQEVLSRQEAALVALAYVTLPMVALASVLISTDTILLPFWAAALWLWLWQLRQGASGGLAWGLAVTMGGCLGLGAMGKYAGFYFLIGAVLVQACVPQGRLPWRNLALALLAFVLVISPNLIWNIANDLQTLQHTADNVDWVQADKGPGFHLDKLAEFFASQLAVMGPVLFVAYLLAVGQGLLRGGGHARTLIAFSLPVLLLVCVQALLSKAYVNWAAMAYPAGVLLVVAYLWTRARWALWAGLAVNLALSLAVAFAATQVTQWQRDGDLLLKRYTGRAAMAEAAFAQANAHGLDAIAASSRDVLADLFYYGAEGRLALFAAPYKGPVPHYYAQKHLLPATVDTPLLFVGDAQTPPCADARLLALHEPRQGAYTRAPLAFFEVTASCLERAK